MRRGPLISIIVPAFNAAECIERCIQSLLAQSWYDLEVIAVNDASSDSTASNLDRIADHDNRVRILHLEKNCGVHAARRRGLAVARGAYIGFVDSDDYVQKDAYQKLLGACKNSSADVAICGAEIVGQTGEVHGDKVRFARPNVVRRNIFDKFCDFQFGSGVLWNKLYRRDLIMRFGSVSLPRSADGAEDYIVNVGCFADAKTVAIVADQLYCYVVQPDSASRRTSNAAGFVRVMRAYESCVRAYCDQHPELLEGIDRLYAYQLQFNCYSVSPLDEFVPYRSELRSICESLAALRPEFVYTLMATGKEGWMCASGNRFTDWLRATKRLLLAARPLRLIGRFRPNTRAARITSRLHFALCLLVGDL
jgi:glycosyltransferase involved in cell wall biosynthesis